jgi:hypothetical protein
LLDLTDTTCRWPMWDDDTPVLDKTYCGGTTLKGQSYCPHHQARAYKPRPGPEDCPQVDSQEPQRQPAAATSIRAGEFRETLDELGIEQQRLARIFHVGTRSVRRWRSGDRRVPAGVAILLPLAHDGKISVTDIEDAAAQLPSSPYHGSDRGQQRRGIDHAAGVAA